MVAKSSSFVLEGQTKPHSHGCQHAIVFSNCPTMLVESHDRAIVEGASNSEIGLSRRKQGFESPRERQSLFVHFDFSSFFGFLPKLAGVVWATLFFLCFS